jgi:hypothetical protein
VRELAHISTVCIPSLIHMGSTVHWLAWWLAMAEVIINPYYPVIGPGAQLADGNIE